MSDWPDNLKMGPIREWPGTLIPDRDRQHSRFKTTGYESYRRKSVPLGDTLELLDREMRMLGAKDAELLVAIAPGDFRLDGKPRAQAKAEHPGIILSFDTKHGHLSYPCDTFTTWQDNLRAVAKGLEALRMVDRFGVTKHGEQYRGFLALEATAMPAGFTSVDGAIAYLTSVIDGDPEASGPAGLRTIVRWAKRRTHPDTDGGSAEAFQRVTAAEQYLKQNGTLS